jgi:Putative peptidoglycan binding domain
MFLVKQGDSGPRAILIQGVLRSLGAQVTIDGHFGPLTAGAVRTFQQRRDVHLSPDGDVGLDTWEVMERLSGFKVINVVDAEDPAQMARVTAGLTRGRASNVIIMHGQSNALAVSINQVLARANSSNSFAMVRFYGHGGEGAQGVALGHNGSLLEHRAGMSVALLPEVRREFARLNDVLAMFGCIDLMGCSVGGGNDGRTLLAGIADAAGRPAEAGIQTQFSQNVGYTPFNFEGPVKVMYPGGAAMSQWCQRVRR